MSAMMNARMIELYKEAGEYASKVCKDYGLGEDKWHSLATGHLAELIVKECARIGELKEQGYHVYDRDISVGWYMKQHFGIE